jgi:predicted sulfurtransferase
MENKEYRVLLYYKFANIDEPENFAKIQLEF